MRFEKPTDYRPLREEVDRLRARAKVLKRDHEAARTTQREALARPPQNYSESAVRAARREVAGVEVEQREVAERIAALEAQLPTKDARAAAEADAKVARDEAQEISGRFAAAWARLLAALKPAEEAAREINSLRHDSRPPIARVEDLNARFGLDVPVPRPLRPDANQARAIAALGLLISETAQEGPRDIVLRELESARRKAAAA